MVFGGVAGEELQINEDTLWSGGPYEPINPEALPHLDEVRQLIFDGRYAEAEALANRFSMGRPLSQMSYQPAGNLWLDFAHEEVDGLSPRTRSRPGSGDRLLFGRRCPLPARSLRLTRRSGARRSASRPMSAARWRRRIRLTSEQPGEAGLIAPDTLGFHRNQPARARHSPRRCASPFTPEFSIRAAA